MSKPQTRKWAHQRERQPNLFRFTLPQELADAVRAEMERRGLVTIREGARVVFTEIVAEWVARGRGAPASAPPPPAAPAVSEPNTHEDDGDLFFAEDKL